MMNLCEFKIDSLILINEIFFYVNKFIFKFHSFSVLLPLTTKYKTFFFKKKNPNVCIKKITSEFITCEKKLIVMLMKFFFPFT